MLQDQKLNSSRIETSLTARVTNSSTSRNTSNISENMFEIGLDFAPIQRKINYPGTASKVSVFEVALVQIFPHSN